MKVRIVLYGMGSKMRRALSWYKEHYEVVAFSDSNPDKADDNPCPEIPYVKPDDIDKLAFDYVVVCSTYAEDILQQLASSDYIDNDKVLTDYELFFKHLTRTQKSYGDKNPDKVIAIMSIGKNNSGLFRYYNLFINFICELVKEGIYPVIDLKNHENSYLEKGELGRVNAWEYYFKQPTEITLDEAYESANVIQMHNENIYIINGNYSLMYNDKNFRNKFHEIAAKYLQLNDEMKTKAELEWTGLKEKHKMANHKILGTLYRGTDYIQLKPPHHRIQPTIDQFVEKVVALMEEWDYEYVYTASDDEDAIVRMREIFGERFLCYERVRFADTDGQFLGNIPFHRERDKYIKGVDYLMEIVLLSRCDALVAGMTAGTEAALVMNGSQYEHDYFFDLGMYR